MTDDRGVPTGSRDRADVRDIVLTQHQMHVLLEDASEKGANKALARIGLENGEARKDVAEMRDMARAFRDARKTMFTTATRLLTIAIIGLLLAGLAMKTNVTKVLKPFAGQ